MTAPGPVEAPRQPAGGPDTEVDELLAELRRRDVRLTVRGDRIDYDAPAGAVDAELLDTMRRLKPALLARLTGATAPVLVTAPASVGQARQYQITTETDFPQVLTVAFRLTLRGRLDVAALRRALTDLTARHAALRTRFTVAADGLWQQVLAPRPVPLPVRVVAADELDRAVQESASVPFDLQREPGFRAVLFADDATDDRHELLLAIHHCFVDGWSVQPMLDDLAGFYRAAVTGQPADLPPLPAEYVDFCRWEQAYLADPATHRMLREWADGLPAGTVPMELPTDRPRRAGATDPGGVVRHTFPPELVAAVTACGAQRGATPYAVFAAAFSWLLHELTGSPTVNLIASVANRTDPRFDRVVGVFAQAALLIVPVAGARSFDDLVRRTARVTWQALARQSVPSLVQGAALGERFVGFPCRVYFDLLDMTDPVLSLPGLDPAPARDVLLAGTRGDLTWALRPLPDGGMTLLIEYATAVLDRATVVDWLDRYQRLLPALLAAPDAPLPRGGGPADG